ncbi:unnamed protein product [Camellia sinensis]
MVQNREIYLQPLMDMESHNMTLSAVLMALISSATTATTINNVNQDLVVAIAEMQTANYFTFVMLINMAPPSLIQANNITFLMPNDRTLAKTTIPENNGVVDFLLRHSIPSPLLFDHLVHIPTGSIIPSSEPKFMLHISNNGRKSFYLNNVRIISPNICTAGSSIRCHGIDGVVKAIATVSPSPSCSNSSSPMAAATPPSPSWPPPSSVAASPVGTPSNAPPPTDQSDSPKKSGSSQPLPFGGLSLGLMMAFLLVFLI